jgi:hypothetical protein
MFCLAPTGVLKDICRGEPKFMNAPFDYPGGSLPIDDLNRASLSLSSTMSDIELFRGG